MNHPALRIGRTRAAIVLATLSLVALTSPGMGEAQTTTITSSGLNTAIRANGTTAFIDGGTRPGTGTARTNLFHSFGNFSIGTGETALFRNVDATGAAGTGYAGTTTNIFGRVTGGTVSNIFGAIDTASQFPQANFWLLNPAGVLFGPNASLNIGGSTNVATADYLKLSDGVRFNAAPGPADGLLSVAAVSAFGFLGTSPLATITLSGTTLTPQSRGLTLVGGNVSLQSDSTGGSLTKPQILSGDGRTNLIAVASSGEIILASDPLRIDPQLAGFTQAGNVTATADIMLRRPQPSGTNTGTLYIHGGKVVLVHSFIQSNFISQEIPLDGSAPGTGKITIQAGTGITDGVQLIDTGIHGQNFGSGSAGAGSAATPPITISGRSIDLQRATILSNNNNEQTAGTISLQALDQIHLSASSLISESTSWGPGGNINLAATSLVMDSQSRVSTDATGEVRLFRTNPTTMLPRGGGAAGDISIQTDTLVLSGGARVSSSTTAESLAGEPPLSTERGSILLTGASAPLASTLAISGPDSGFFTETTGNQLGGNIDLRVANLTLDNAARISAITSSNASTASGGTISITGNTLSLSRGAAITAASMQQPAGASVATTAAATAGNISATVPTIRLDGAATTMTASSEGGGNAGTITLDTQTVTLTDKARVSSSLASGSTGTAGTILIHGNTLSISGNGTIETTTAGASSGGSIRVQSNTGNTTLTNELTITAQSTSPQPLANAGKIELSSSHDLVIRNSTITTAANSASGGGIKLTAPNLIRIVDSTLSSSVQGQAGSNGGNINIDPQLVVIQNSNLLANANAGAGGNITVIASGAVLVDPNSQLNASAGPAGVSGSVNINTPVQVLGGALVPLKIAYSQAGLSGDRCAADPKGQFSSFVQTGRDGVPQVPGALSPSPLSFLDSLTSGSLDLGMKNLAAAQLGFDSLSLNGSAYFQFHSACRS